MVAEAERLPAQWAVLGSMLLEDGLVGEVLAKVTPTDFTTEKCRMVFQAIRSVFASGEPVDPVTVLNKLGGQEDGEWARYLTELMETTPTASNVWEYVRILREQARLYQLNTLGELLREAADLDKAGAYIGKINALQADRPGVRIVNMEQAMMEFIERQNTRHEYLTWPFEKLNAKLFVEGGDLVVLGGYPSAGKTAAALMIAWWWANRGKKVGFFSLETGDKKLHDRLMAHTMKLDFGEIKRGELKEADFEALAIASPRLIKAGLEYIDASGMTVADIQAIALSRRYDAIFVDYIQLVEGDTNHRYDIVTGVSIGLHRMAQSNGITVVALSQLSRPEKSGRDDKAPGMSSLRESGQIEQDADVIMLLYKEEDTPNARRVLKIAKNKEGEVGVDYLAFDGRHQTFRESVVDAPAPRSRREPEYKQVEFRELPQGQDDDDPFSGGRGA